jgi:hypothetical protein
VRAAEAEINRHPDRVMLALLLAEEDVEEIGAVLAPGSIPAVPGYDSTWAEPRASSTRRSRGQLVANGRVSTQALWPRSKRTHNANCKEPDMPLARGRRGRRGVIGAPVARTAAVAGTAAVVPHGHDRGEDRRDDRGPGILR